MSCLQTGFERGDLKLDCFSHIANAEKAAVETKKLRDSKNCREESKFQFRRNPEVETLKGQLETELVQVGTDTNTDSCGLVSSARIQLGSAVRAELCEDKRQSCAELRVIGASTHLLIRAWKFQGAQNFSELLSTSGRRLKKHKSD